MLALTLPTTIYASYKIITPMFIGDAKQEPTQIAPQSVKGALRFWWRAVMWQDCLKSANNDQISALKTLHHQEAVLFGSSSAIPDKYQSDYPAKQKNYGRGCVMLRVIQPDKITRVENWPKSLNSNSGYLALGLTKTKNAPAREAIQEGIEFGVELQCDAALGDAERQSLTTALQCLGLFGGLGSRSRRAMGAIQLTQLNDEQISFADATAYKKTCDDLLKGLTAEQAPYSALTQDARFAVSQNTESTARDAHAALGSAFKQYRGEPSSLRGESKKVFGLPLQNVDMKSRRASPLFFHVAELADGDCVASVLFLPTTPFHPAYDNINYKLPEGFLKRIQGGQS